MLALGDGSLVRPEEIVGPGLAGAPLIVLDLDAPAPPSLVMALLRVGAAAVLATRLRVPAETSASFLEGFYRGLADGRSAGEAVRLAVQRTGLPVFRYFGHPGLRVQPGIRVRVPADLGPPSSIPRRPAPPRQRTRQPGGPALAMDLVTIPAGEFFFGFTDAQARLVREAIHGREPSIEGFLPTGQQGRPVSIDSFAIGKYPVTNAQFAEFVRDTGRPPPLHWEGAEPPERLLDHPVVQVSWGAAKAFCQWLRARTGRGFRLPTEEQWEKAARGTDARLYPWGTRFEPSRVHFGKRGTAPVTAHSPEGPSSEMSPCSIWRWNTSSPCCVGRRSSQMPRPASVSGSRWPDSCHNAVVTPAPESWSGLPRACAVPELTQGSDLLFYARRSTPKQTPAEGSNRCSCCRPRSACARASCASSPGITRTSTTEP